MAETYTNKVVLGNGTVLIDISTDTIEKSDVINKKHSMIRQVLHKWVLVLMIWTQVAQLL